MEDHAQSENGGQGPVLGEKGSLLGNLPVAERGHIRTVIEHLPAHDGDQTKGRFQQRGFAAAVGAQQCQNLSRPEFQRHIFYDGLPVVPGGKGS